jgi:hypothetical protein
MNPPISVIEVGLVTVNPGPLANSNESLTNPMVRPDDPAVLNCVVGVAAPRVSTSVIGAAVAVRGPTAMVTNRREQVARNFTATSSS